MNKKKIIGIGIGIIVVGLIGVYFYKKRKEKNVDNFDPEFDVVDKSMSDDSSGGLNESKIYETPIHPKLKWVSNPKLARYLSGLLNESQMRSLSGWVRLIKAEKSKDSSKWKDSSGLTGQTSIIGHSLSQMGVWNADILDALLGSQ